MYCKNCGANVDGRKKFCKNCGATIRKVTYSDYEEVQEKIDRESDPEPYQPTPPPLPRVIPLIAVLSSLVFFVGIGHLSVGKANRAIIYILIWWPLNAIVLILAFNVNMSILYYSFPFLGTFQIWICIDVFIAARRFNQYVAEHKKKPKMGEKW